MENRKPESFSCFASTEWERGDPLGFGSFASVHLAIPRNGNDRFPRFAAVKSCEALCAATLENERQVLDRIGSCPEIVECFGESYSVEKGERLYNLFLEYASGGSLEDHVKRCGGWLPESEIRRCTRSILRGLRHVHSRGFAHCDVKLQNVLVFDNGDVKLSDFGLAKDSREEQSARVELRGTPMYMSPESVNDNKYGPSSDIWAAGCAVVEMATGKPVWNCEPGSNIFSLLTRIGEGEELPEFPPEFSEEGKDFLTKCFVKNSERRWTAEMLLGHPFLAADNDGRLSEVKAEEPAASPRSHFDCEWISTTESSAPCSPEWGADERSHFGSNPSSSPADRLKELSTAQPDWSASDSWVRVK